MGQVIPIWLVFRLQMDLVGLLFFPGLIPLSAGDSCSFPFSPLTFLGLFFWCFFLIPAAKFSEKQPRRLCVTRKGCYKHSGCLSTSSFFPSFRYFICLYLANPWSWGSWCPGLAQPWLQERSRQLKWRRSSLSTNPSSLINIEGFSRDLQDAMAAAVAFKIPVPIFPMIFREKKVIKTFRLAEKHLPSSASSSELLNCLGSLPF